MRFLSWSFRGITEIVDIRGFGIPEQVPIKFGQDIAPEDKLLEIRIWMFSQSGIRTVGVMHMFNPKQMLTKKDLAS